jgi:hypothetical protein
MVTRILLADIVYYLHISLIFYVLSGIFILPCNYLTTYIIFIILVLLDWNDFDGMCILTKIEHYLREDEWINQSPVEGGPEFFRPIVNNMFGLSISTPEAERLNNFVFISCLLIAFLRLRYRCDIIKF